MKPLAPELNAFSFTFDPELLWPLRAAFSKHLSTFFYLPENKALLSGVYYQSRRVGDYYLLSYDTYPLLWLTNHNLNSYQLFHDFFEQLSLNEPLKPYIPFRRKLVMYSGFFVVGNRAHETMWHYDYRPEARAYTLITPLFDWRPEHGHLLYKSHEQAETSTYTYKKGEAVLLGDGVLHSTEPYAPTDSLRVLVSLTFGSDRWKHWPVIEKNISEQSYYYHLPCGHPVNACGCRGKKLLARIGR